MRYTFQACPLGVRHGYRKILGQEFKQADWIVFKVVRSGTLVVHVEGRTAMPFVKGQRDNPATLKKQLRRKLTRRNKAKSLKASTVRQQAARERAAQPAPVARTAGSRGRVVGASTIHRAVFHETEAALCVSKKPRAEASSHGACVRLRQPALWGVGRARGHAVS